MPDVFGVCCNNGTTGGSGVPPEIAVEAVGLEIGGTIAPIIQSPLGLSFQLFCESYFQTFERL